MREDWINKEIEEENNKTPRFNAPSMTSDEKIDAILTIVKRDDSLMRELKHLLRGIVLSEPDRILSVKEAAKHCEVGEETVRRWLRDGKLHKVWLKGKEGLLLSDLDAAIEID